MTEKSKHLDILAHGVDSSRLLAAAALDVAVGRAPMPAWRGGPRAN